MNKPDDFRIDLCVTHPSANPSIISESLGIQPKFVWGVGDLVGRQRRTSTLWRGTLVDGTGSTEFERALKSIVLLLSDRLGFLNQAVSSGGKLSLTIRTFAETQHGKVAEIHLSAPFLEALALLRIELAFEVWMNTEV